MEKLALWSQQISDALFLHPAFSCGWVLTVIVGFIKTKGFSNLSRIALFQLLLSLCLFSLQISEEPRFALSLAAYFAILIGIALHKSPTLLAIASVLGLSLQFFSVQLYSFGIKAPFLAAPRTSWLVPIQYSNLQMEPTIDTIVSTCRIDTTTVNTVGVNVKYFNAVSLSFYSRRHFLVLGTDRTECVFTDFGWAETDAERAWIRTQALRPSFIIFPKDMSSVPADPYNRVNQIILDKLETSDAQDYKPVPGPKSLQLFKLMRENIDEMN
jgi:hypothetical protein